MLGFQFSQSDDVWLGLLVAQVSLQTVLHRNTTVTELWYCLCSMKPRQQVPRAKRRWK